MSLLQNSPIKETIFCWNLRWSPSYQMVPSSPWISHVSYICVCVCGNELYYLFRVDTHYDPPIMRWLPLASSIKHRSLFQTSPTKETYILQKGLVFSRSPQICYDRPITMMWLHLVGSFKLYVSFANEPYKRDYILQKRPIILRSLRIVATPYMIPSFSRMSHTSCMHGWYRVLKIIGLFCRI